MTFIPKAASAVVIGIGLAGAIVATPAEAQKKPKKGEEAAAAAPQLKLSEKFRKAAVPLQAAVAANDGAALSAAVAAATPAATTNDEKYYLNAVQIPYHQKQTDRAGLIAVLEQLVSNPSTPADAMKQYNYFLGALAFEKKESARALPYFRRARELGYTSENFGLQYAQALIDSGDVAGGVAELQKAIDAETAAGRKAPEPWYSFAVSRLYQKGDRAEANVWLKRALAAYPSPQNWRRSILVYRDGAEKAKQIDKAQRLDLYRLLRITKALADRNDYLEYADIAYQGGLPNEAIRMIAEGKAAGAIPAADGSAANIVAGAQSALRQDLPLATLEKQAASAATGKVAQATGDVAFASGEFAKATALYKLGLQKGGVDVGKTNLHLGMALAQSGQHAEARAAFANVTGPVDKEIAGFWVQWIDLQGAAPVA
jgi:hypothetical protein